MGWRGSGSLDDCTLVAPVPYYRFSSPRYPPCHAICLSLSIPFSSPVAWPRQRPGGSPRIIRLVRPSSSQASENPPAVTLVRCGLACPVSPRLDQPASDSKPLLPPACWWGKAGKKKCSQNEAFTEDASLQAFATAAPACLRCLCIFFSQLTQPATTAAAAPAWYRCDCSSSDTGCGGIRK